MSAGVYIELNGKPVDMSEVDWFLRAPCGCVAGATVGFSDHFERRHLVTTPEQAMAEFYEYKTERERDEKLGYTTFPDYRVKVTEYMRAKCPHDPKWGHPKPPQPDGYDWAVGGYYGSYTRALHLVPTASIRTDDYDPPSEAREATTLCGTRKYNWDKRWHAKRGQIECSRCTKRAAS